MSAAAQDPMKKSSEEEEELRDFSARAISDPISPSIVY
jgi:hypothetical protein